jgi:zinc protease
MMKLRIIPPALALMAILFPSVYASGQPWRPAIERFRLENGLSVILHRDTSFDRVHVAMAFHSGSSLDPAGKSGTASLTASLMLEGTRTITSDATEKFQRETQTNFSSLTDGDCTTFFSTSHTSNLRTILSIEADRLAHVADHFTEARFKGLVSDVLAQRKKQKNLPLDGLDARMREELYPKKHPYCKPIEGTTEDISKLRLADLKDFALKYYHAGNASLVIGGNIDLDHARAMIQELFRMPAGKTGRIPSIKVAAPQNLGQVVVTSEANVGYSRLIMVFPTVNSSSPDEPVFQLAARILAGSINSRLRSKLADINPYVVSVDAYQATDLLSGAFWITVNCRYETPLQGIHDRVLEILEDMAVNGVTENELAEARNRSEMSFYTSAEELAGPGGRCDMLNTGNLFFGDPFHSFAMRESQSKVNSTAVQLCIQRFLHRNNLLATSIVPLGKLGQAVVLQK